MKIYKTNGEAKFEIENIESEESEKIKVKIAPTTAIKIPNIAPHNSNTIAPSLKIVFIISITPLFNY